VVTSKGDLITTRIWNSHESERGERPQCHACKFLVGVGWGAICGGGAMFTCGLFGATSAGVGYAVCTLVAGIACGVLRDQFKDLTTGQVCNYVYRCGYGSGSELVRGRTSRLQLRADRSCHERPL
jgi:hypothetical protein